VDLEDDDTPFKPQLPGSVTPRRSPEDRAKDDTEAALDWLQKKPNDDTKDPTGVFTNLDSMLPTKPGQPVENKLFRHRKKANQATNLPLLGRHPFCVQQQDEAIHFLASSSNWQGNWTKVACRDPSSLLWPPWR
jgi:hypothetical protein